MNRQLLLAAVLSFVVLSFAPIFFWAGEHASLSHAWIQGAIESGVRAASEIHDRAVAS